MTTTHEQIKVMLQPRIEALGYNIEQFDPLHFDVLTNLSNANIELTDNLLNPAIELKKFKFYMTMIVSDLNNEKMQRLKPVIAYYQSEMGFNELHKIRDALENKDSHLLELYLSVYDTLDITFTAKSCMFDLIEKNLPYESLLNPILTRDEILEFYRYQLNKAEPQTDPNAKFNNPEFMRNLLNPNTK